MKYNLQAFECQLIVTFCLYYFNIHKSNSIGVYLIIICMCANESNKGPLSHTVYINNQAILIATNIEKYSAIRMFPTSTWLG